MYGSQRMPADVTRFIELCESGTLYDEMLGWFGITPDHPNYHAQRQELKKNLFRDILFAPEKLRYRSLLRAQFAGKFPPVWRLIQSWAHSSAQKCATGQCPCQGNHHSVGNWELALNMQRSESTLMIGGPDSVANHLRQHHRRDFLGTVHDSLILDQSLIAESTEVMQRHFAALGINVTTKIKPLTLAG
jgi:hypothetical protein